MKKAAIAATVEEAGLYSQIIAGFAGCWPDNVSIDRFVVESRKCPCCLHGLEYRAFASLTTYRAFGICIYCAYAREFISENHGKAVAVTLPDEPRGV